MTLEKKVFNATGRRKESSAQVKIKIGTGKIMVNEKSLEDYIRVPRQQSLIKLPLILTSSENGYDITITVKGGGTTGQTDAIKLGIARALILVNPKFRPILKKEGLLTRDSRIIERKKYGHPKARKKFQFSKR
ncbi:MAG: 30S ribosomal protein S9 [bacterium]|nr:30S ribosomal protein S9 [bacterium]